MKGLSITGFIFGILALTVALYNQYVVITELESVDALMSNATNAFETEIYSVLWSNLLDSKINIGMTAMGLGITGVLLTFAPILKAKKKLALVGGLLGLVAAIIGLLQSMA
jgi:hypothetical protein